MVPVRVNVLSSISDGAEAEEIRQEMMGRFAEKRDEWVLRYVERTGENAEMRTTVKAREDCITVIRNGDLGFRHTYCPGKTATSWIHTPAGTAEMEVKTLDYRRRRWEGGGELRFSYDLRMGGENLGKYVLHIQWREEPWDDRTDADAGDTP
jgi:uncharacterized beta-barrel protein YwiB (DUF1934 family)